MTVVYSGGTYDLLHPGHLYVLRRCRELAGSDGQVVVGLNSDEFVAAFKAHPPVQSYLVRSEVLAAVRYVDRVVPNLGGADSRPILGVVAPDIIAVGRDYWSPDDSKYCRQMGFDRAWLAEHGIRLAYIDWLPGFSSTGIREKARSVAA